MADAPGRAVLYGSDPSGLPVRFFAGDAICRRAACATSNFIANALSCGASLRGMRMALNMPVAAFDGVSLWLVPGEAGDQDALAVVLKHRDPTLTLPLFLTSRPDEALAEWRAWSQVLDVPLLLADQRGVFDLCNRATRPTSRRAPASPPPATQRAEGPTTFNSSQARNRQNYKRVVDPPRRTRDYCAKLDFSLEAAVEPICTAGVSPRRLPWRSRYDQDRLRAGHRMYARR